MQDIERNAEGIIINMQGFRIRERELFTHLVLSCSVEVLPSDKEGCSLALGSSLFFASELPVMRDLSRRAAHWHRSQTWKHNEVKFHSDCVGIIAECLR